jgi:addiction module RelE/StbE family toxin
MLPITWSAAALDDLDDHISYIAARSPRAALDLHERIERSVDPVARLPELFRLGRIPGTREIVAHPNYIVVYKVEAGEIVVLNVLHARQQYPK